MADVEHITTHITDAQDRLLGQFHGKPRIEGIVGAFANGWQILEDVFWDLYTGRQIDTAVGEQLDILGAIVGRERKGLNDDEYRVQIIGKIAINCSKGLVDHDIIPIFKLLTGSTLVHFIPLHPAECLIMGNVDFSDKDVAAIYQIMQDIVAGGVKVIGIGWWVDPDPDPDPTTDAPFSFEGCTYGKGFGDVDNPDLGGKFAELIYVPIYP